MPLLQKRIGLLFAIFLGLLGLAFARALWMGTIRADDLAQAALVQHEKVEEVPARRGTITDRRGVELAVSEAAADVSATPYLVKDPLGTARKLADLLRLPEDELLKQLTRKDTGFVYLARKVPADRAAKLGELALPGITLDPAERRTYPRSWVASQVLGTVGLEGKGLSGIEYSRDELLAGTPGTRRTVRDALGDPIELQDLKPAKAGKTLQLTLDSAIQDRTERVLRDLGAKYTPKGATAIVMDPRTNEVLAMANWPQIDANRPGAAPASAQQNRATGYTYEPGSTFKAFTVAGALEDGKVQPDTPFDLPPQIQVADRVIGESHPRGPVTLTTKGILEQSSNVGAIKIGQTLGKERFDFWIRRFGFGRPTGVDLPGEERGLLLPVEKYSGSSMGNLPIGQGESVTPIQMAMAYSAIANGGVLRPPRVVRKVGDRVLPPRKGRRIISERTSAQLRQMLEGVFRPGGTASEVALPGYSLAGKTGTANKVDTTYGGYSESRYIASFIGFAPAKDPRLLISVMVDEPHGAIYGGEVAAPAFGRIASFALPYLKVPPDQADAAR